MSAGQGSGHFSRDLDRGPYNATVPHSGGMPFSMHVPTSLSPVGVGMHQHQQYPGINSIPGMQSMSQISGLQAIPGLQSMPGMQSFSNLPGIGTMSSLLPPPPVDAPASHQPLPPSHLSSHFPSPGLLSGAVDKRRKPRKARGYPRLADDETSLMMGTHSSHVLPPHAEPTPPPPLSPQAPIYEADGIQFKLLEQLPDTKIQRLRSEKIKPIERLTFSDIKAYNRNQLRAYCSVYGIRRKKKADMERDMAKYAALFHPNEPDYDVHKFLPTEYAEGPIPRRKVPVTKEQKEQAAGDFKQLTNALHQRTQLSTVTGMPLGDDGGGGGGGGGGHHAAAFGGLVSAAAPLASPPPPPPPPLPSVAAAAAAAAAAVAVGGPTMHTLGGAHGSLSSPMLAAAPRLHDIHGTESAHGSGALVHGNGVLTHHAHAHAHTHAQVHAHAHGAGAHGVHHHHHPAMHPHHAHDEHDGGAAVGNGVHTQELMSVPDMHVPHHLLSISQQMGDE